MAASIRHALHVVATTAGTVALFEGRFRKGFRSGRGTLGAFDLALFVFVGGEAEHEACANTLLSHLAKYETTAGVYKKTLAGNGRTTDRREAFVLPYKL